jgi:hypothetical protein
MVFSGGRCSCTAAKKSTTLKGSAFALPTKFSVVLEHDPPVKNSQTPNEFGA